MRANLPPVLIAGIVLLMISCSKKSAKPTPAPPNDSTGTTSGGSGKITDVYVAGSDNGQACYWKNDTEVVLSTTQPSAALSISVNGKDVYVCGWVNYEAAYWKNGVGMSLQPKTTGGTPAVGYYYARGGCLGDSNYYVCIDQGVELPDDPTTDTYLKIQPSGSLTEYGLPDAQNGAHVYSIAVSGTDVYCAGSGIENVMNIGGHPNLLPFATIWKNGAESSLSAPTSLEPGGDIVYGFAYGVATSGTDVYAAGALAPGQSDESIQSFYSNPVYWKNNVPQTLPGPNGPVAGAACAIAVSGSDVYIAGNVDYTDNYDSPVFWKNGVVSVLSTGEVTATSIGVSPSGDVYVTGNVTVDQPGEDGTTAILWKNGSQTTLGTSAASAANAVFLYTH